MLLLMRRVGEIVRINKTVTLKIKEILQNEQVVFQIEGLDTKQSGKLIDKRENKQSNKKSEKV